MSTTNDWQAIQRHYDRCFEAHGISPKGVDWPSARDLEARFATHLRVLERVVPGDRRPVLLDLGCGPGLLVDYLTATGRKDVVEYRGIDLSEAMVAAARARWPEAPLEVRDIVADPLPPGSVDVVVMNGVLTERVGIPRERMVELAQSIVTAAFRASRVGISFNAMSRHADREREDLFHWGLDEVAGFLTKSLTRHYTIAADYGLYEFTAFAWHTPKRPAPCEPEQWWIR